MLYWCWKTEPLNLKWLTTIVMLVILLFFTLRQKVSDTGFFFIFFFTNIKFTNVVFQCYRIRLRLCWPSRRKMTVQAMNIYCPPSLTAPPPGWPGQCLCYWSRSAETWPCPWGFRAACLCPAAAPADSQSDTRRRRRRRRWWEGGGAEKVGKKRRTWTNGRVDELKCCLKMMA